MRTLTTRPQIAWGMLPLMFSYGQGISPGSSPSSFPFFGIVYCGVYFIHQTLWIPYYPVYSIIYFLTPKCSSYFTLALCLSICYF